MEVGTRMMMRIFLFPAMQGREISRKLPMESIPLNMKRRRT
jgi:hypothetical protein